MTAWLRTALFGFALSWVGSAVPVRGQALPPLQGFFEGIVSSGAAARAEWSALAISLVDGDTLFLRNGDEPLVPASNTKLLTTAAAFHLLGPDFRYQTFLVGAPSAGGTVVDGDLTLFGTGDPALSERFTRRGSDPLRELADRLVASGIRAVTGDLVADGSYLNGDARFHEWPADDLDDWFTAPVGGLSYNENLVTLRTTPGTAPGTPPHVETFPAIGREPILNQASTRAGGGRPDLIITRYEPDGPITIVGSVSMANRPIWKRITVQDPARFAGEALHSMLVERGVSIGGTVRVAASPGASSLNRPQAWAPGIRSTATPTVLVSHASPPLRELLTVVNRESNNFYAETVFKTLGRVVGGDGTYDTGRRVVADFLIQVVGIPPDQVLQRDGSGLSPQNRVSANAFVRLLEWIHESPHRDDLFETLPEAGQRRGLGRMYQTAAARNLRAKTGTIASVSSLSGYVTTRDGVPVAFSIISNGLRSRSLAKRLEDRIGVGLAELDVKGDSGGSR